MSWILLVISLVLFVSLVAVHEFGHFLVARRNGVKILEYGIGFPPRLWARKTKEGWDFSLNLVPLGGFVRLKGEHDTDKGPGSYGSASVWTKSKILLAGVGMNLVAAFVILTVLGWVGMPKIIDSQFTITKDQTVASNKVLITYVEPGSPAEKAGLQFQDQLIRISDAGSKVSVVADSDTLPSLTKTFAGKTVNISYKRNGELRNTAATLRTTQEVNADIAKNDPKGYLGVEPINYSLLRYTWSAPLVALGLMKQITVLTFSGIGSIFSNLAHGDTKDASSKVAGPVGIFFLLKDGSHLGYQFVLIIIAVISLTLAIMNALPIPALDGGRLFVTLVSRAFKKPLKQRTEEIVHGTGFVLLMTLILIITVADVKKHF